MKAKPMGMFNQDKDEERFFGQISRPLPPCQIGESITIHNDTDAPVHIAPTSVERIVAPETDDAYRDRLRMHQPEMPPGMISALTTASGYALDIIGQYCDGGCPRRPAWAAMPELMLKALYPRARMLLRVWPKADRPLNDDFVILCRPFEGVPRDMPGGPYPIDPMHLVVPAHNVPAFRRALIDAGPWR